MVSIDVRNASVDFPIFDAKNRSLKKSVLGRAGGRITDAKVPVVEALRDVTLSLRQGDRVGLVGHNGAGKSTLLRLLAGIYEPTRGRTKIEGRVAPVFDLAVGMDPEISGLENILIRGLFLGMTRKEMERRVDEIADFTELGDYLTMPLRTYSTGMRVRLALGVVTSIDPEILILDEGIGAVDAAFLEKARDRLRDLVSRSGMLVFASHSDEFLVELCDTAIWMDTGEIREQGDLRDVVSHYKGRDLFESLSPDTLRRLEQQRGADDGTVGGPADAAADQAADQPADETVGLS
jgi:homopolymeric O-antigen transport system ATP-binding protein